ncbi:MAG: hypothetical protein CMJ64_01920 [Planctomycetaceae bacterium]|nr:hypothetical protein [Planctomycetaceae bacterium]
MKVRLTLWSLFTAAAVMATGCVSDIRSHNLPPAEQLFQPGPGIGGPGPGVLPPQLPPMMSMGGGRAIGGGGAMGGAPASRPTVQILFNRPESMQIRWDVSGVGQFDSEPLIVPGRQNFPEGGIFRLKVTNIGGREGVELYPTLEVGPTTPRTAAYLAHNAIPVQVTEEDFDQVLSGNYVTKVIYLPDPEFQEMALAGVETLVSTRLDPGVDPIVEADRRGSIMAVVRLGNKDVEMPGANGDSVIAAQFINSQQPQGVPMGMPRGPTPIGMATIGPQSLASAPISGINMQPYGYTSVSTPLGLPGPPHIPFGGPAGFQSYIMRNRTHYHIPGPTERFTVRMRETPGYSSPRPPSHMSIREQRIHPSLPYRQSTGNQTQVIPMNGTGYHRGHGH